MVFRHESSPAVSTHSIRYRILKALFNTSLVLQLDSFNPFDPIQDTERLLQEGVRLAAEPVSTHSIRYRILKVSDCFCEAPVRIGFNPFDPIQDTESFATTVLRSPSTCFNPFDPIQDTESGVPAS